MKQLNKAKIFLKNYDLNVIRERELMEKMNHPFLVSMYFSFQDKENLYMIFDLIEGGDLRYWYIQSKKFSEEEGKFIIACLILSLEYLHTNKLIHRDIKPENVLFSKKGYVYLSDFGASRSLQSATDESIIDTSGTPVYMSPEALLGKNHSYQSDYYSLGMLLYEMMFQRRPFGKENRNEIKKIYQEFQIQIIEEDYQNLNGWSPEAIDFVNKLLLRSPEERLGASGIDELKNHVWFDGFDWKGLYLKQMIPPFVPNIDESFNPNYYEKNSNISPINKKNNIMRNEKECNEIMKDFKKINNYKYLFNNFVDFNKYSSSARNKLFLFKNPHNIYEDDNNSHNNSNDERINGKRDEIYSYYYTMNNISSREENGEEVIKNNGIYGKRNNLKRNKKDIRLRINSEI